MPQPKKTEKAYRNPDFLSSPDARLLRILSEFLEPLSRFRTQGIRDTIVFFGSARIRPRKEAEREYKRLVAKSRGHKRLNELSRQELERAKSAVEMSQYYEEAVELSRLLTDWSKKLCQLNRFVVCSGGGPGIMEAANKGAQLAAGRSIGLNISLPFEQSANPYVSRELTFDFHYFFMRKFWFVYLSKALIVFPGGFGTMDEFMEVLTLMQTSKIKKKMTIILYGSKYWKEIINFDAMLSHGVIDPRDLKLFAYADSPKEAFKTLISFLRKNYPTETAETKTV